MTAPRAVAVPVFIMAAQPPSSSDARSCRAAASWGEQRQRRNGPLFKIGE
jgi:hypothetical protein